MKHKKWLVSAVLAFVAVVAITLYTEAYLDMGRNAAMLVIAFVGIALILRFLFACFSAVKSAAPQVRQQLDEASANKAAPEADPTPRCAKCGSTSISADKKGFGVGKAVVGTAVAGPIGLVAGNIGAKNVSITCLNCGHRWKAGKS